jgi:hypothetical protein
MSKVFVIGDRLKSEWVSELDTENKNLQFANQLDAAKTYEVEDYARQQLQELRKTGYFNDLQVYLKEDGRAFKLEERDSFQP